MYESIPTPQEQPTVPLWPTAGRALGMERSGTYAAAERGQLPVTVLRCGNKLRVSTAELRSVLMLDGVHDRGAA